MDFMRPGSKTVEAIRELPDGGGQSFQSSLPRLT